ncbi:site-specific integrase [Frondihabitans sp. VKM Ac-2883]|uniref:tyrosine-type recombinase/integrase n=1 Tax=Frondihabitans sp. VKM Ac-2883 TaxID=2783823 RepID=UPI00188B1F2F|nr:site-specific integrase [Frondihabitans sp. VKM Ac-2883]MBF4575060.1 site-specific integrase [Frondihabitans sp. VKM Ac-2883]
MASVESYSTKAGLRYRVRYRTPDRRQTDKKGFRTKEEARLFLASVEVSKARGDFIDASASRVTVGELGAGWLDTQTQLKPSSLRPLEIAWRLYVEPRWGGVRVGEVRHSEVQAWVTSLTQGEKARGATTVLRVHGVLSSILDAAVRDRRILMNPARDLNLPRKTPKPQRFLTHVQVERLASESGRHGTLVRFLAYTGLRWGEATALRLRDLDMLRRRAMVEQNAVNVGGHIIVGTPKSHKTRSVPFPSFLAEDLARTCEGKGRDDLVFGTGSTHLRSPDNRRGWYVGARTRCIATDSTFPKLTIHDLRHTAASLAISSGANVKAVQRLMGHASAAMTLDVYGSLFDDDLDAVATALDNARSRAVVGDVWAETVSGN